MTEAATYEVIYIRENGDTWVIEKRGAPRSEAIWRWCQGHTGYFPRTAQNIIFAIRFFPRRNKWGIYDLRDFRERLLPWSGKVIVKTAPVRWYVPDKDAAIMFARLRLNG